MTQDNIEENIRLQRAGDLAVQLREAQSERDALLKQIESLKNLVLMVTVKLMNSS